MTTIARPTTVATDPFWAYRAWSRIPPGPGSVVVTGSIPDSPTEGPQRCGPFSPYAIRRQPRQETKLKLGRHGFYSEVGVRAHGGSRRAHRVIERARHRIIRAACIPASGLVVIARLVLAGALAVAPSLVVSVRSPIRDSAVRSLAAGCRIPATRGDPRPPCRWQAFLSRCRASTGHCRQPSSVRPAHWASRPWRSWRTAMRSV